MKRGPTTDLQRFVLFRLRSVDRPFRTSMSAAHDHGLEYLGAYISAFNLIRTSFYSYISFEHIKLNCG